MGRRIGIVLAVGLLVVAGLFVLARQQTALAQARQAEELQREKTRDALDMLTAQAIDTIDLDRRGLRWEYKVLSLPDRDEEANQWLAKLANEGWEFVTLVQPAVPRRTVMGGNTSTTDPATPARLLFKRRQQRSVADSAEKGFIPLDLKAKTNHKRMDSFQRGRYPGNTLASLPPGAHTFHGITFQVGEGVIQLGSTLLQEKPAKVAGIPVGMKFSKLHVLHATGFVAEQATPIGIYTVHYDDGTSATIPIVYGTDVLDWWKYPGDPEPTRGKVAWEGENEGARRFGAIIRLYLTTWENPQPAKTVTSIDYASTMDADCAPFCVAMTVEEPKG